MVKINSKFHNLFFSLVIRPMYKDYDKNQEPLNKILFDFDQLCFQQDDSKKR